MSVENFLKWSDSNEMAKTRIIVNLMDEVAELKREKAEGTARKECRKPFNF